MKKEYSWEAESDANTLRRYQEIVSDRERLGRAQEFLQDSVTSGVEALRGSGFEISIPPSRGRRNPATLMRM